MNVPFLSTNFSENGKQAKKRFENLFSTKKKIGMTAIAVVAVAAIVLSGLVAYTNNISADFFRNNTAVSETDELIARELFDSKIKYVGNASGVGKILGLSGCPTLGKWNHFELETTTTPYGIVCCYTGSAQNPKSQEKIAALVLSLIDNADFIRFIYHADISESEILEDFSYSRNELDSRYGILSQHSSNFNDFTQFYNSHFAD